MTRQRMHVPERLRWAVDIVAADSPAAVLEIGCGRGVAIDLLCDRLGGASKITGVDRSTVAIGTAAVRNARHIAAGRVQLVHADIAEAPLGDATFDFVFAVNVNVFWVGSADEELAAVKRALAPGGRLALIYEPPSAQQALSIEARCTRNLEENGLATLNVTSRQLNGNPGVCILARASSTE